MPCGSEELECSSRSAMCDKCCSVCNGAGPSKCGDCSTRYTRNNKGVCEDVDECEVESLCSSGTYCENTAGSHDCEG
ncbi:protein disulfide isomerase Creld2-like isoform X4 [Halichondria panicea]|uniref:protein disulfide isomerase Creld2-like isoform X4 n=1 Tax=Halichondria panicea TaxID=6063 RepID=UPI00312B2BA3